MSSTTVILNTSTPTHGYLIVLKGPLLGTIFQLGPQVTIGRDETNDITVDDGTISTHHARIDRIDGPAFQLKDLESANGTQVNGQRIECHLLANNDVITIGRTDLVFKRVG